MDVSAKLAVIAGFDAGSSTAHKPSNELTATNSKSSPAFRSAKVFHTTSSPAGASNRCNSARMITPDPASSPRGHSAYNASVRVCAFAQADTHKMSNKALNVHDMVTLRRHYIRHFVGGGESDHLGTTVILGNTILSELPFNPTRASFNSSKSPRVSSRTCSSG